MVALIGDQPIAYAEAFSDWVGRDALSGTAVVVTADIVVRATFKDAPATDEAVSGSAGGSVDVNCWGRHTVQSISINASDDDWNRDIEWDGGLRGIWPRSGRATVQFDGGNTLELPLKPRDAEHPTQEYWEGFPAIMGAFRGELETRLGN
jgi:hypothetical protein